MDDKQIIELYLDRDKLAISRTSEKYGGLCYSIAYNILFSSEDSEECVNDALLSAWNSIPPHIPEHLSAFLAKITRRLSITRLRANTAKKRHIPTAPFDELSECTACKGEIYENVEAEALKDSIQRFLMEQPTTARIIFIRRYFYCDSVDEISRRLHFSKSKVKTTLFRCRNKLKTHLIKEGLLDD